MSNNGIRAAILARLEEIRAEEAKRHQEFHAAFDSDPYFAIRVDGPWESLIDARARLEGAQEIARLVLGEEVEACRALTRAHLVKVPRANSYQCHFCFAVSCQTVSEFPHQDWCPVLEARRAIAAAQQVKGKEVA